MDVDAVCTAIAAAITAAELTVNDHQVTATPYAADSYVVPHFYTAEFEIPYDQTFAANPQMTLTCRLLLSSADDLAGQQQSKKLTSTGVGTLHQAFRDMRGDPGQPALSGACDDLHLRLARGPRLLDVGGEVFYYGIEFTVFVMG
jgi:hypothetical protein